MKLQIPKITTWKLIAGIIFLIGFYATVLRFGKGLGESTNLSDQFPWGLWIGFDVLVGVGLAAGGFIIAATVHIFHLHKYESISRPALLTAFLGYLLVIVGLLFDLGLPYRIWHPLIMWNPHSVMFEVGWCVTLYTTVLALEFSPIVFEKFNLKVPLKIIRMIYLPLVIAGVILSTLHQSSLGTLYVLVPDKLYGLWYSPLLPVLFFISAIGAGLAMTIVESFLSSRAFGKKIEQDILSDLARVLVVILGLYLLIRFQNLYYSGNLQLAFQLNQKSILFWGEIGLGSLIPMMLLFNSKMRESESGLFFSSMLVVVGFIIGRMNVSITGMIHSETYFPKWSEIAITVSIVTLGFVLFTLAVKYFPVFPKSESVKMNNNTPSSGKVKGSIFSGKIVLGMWAFFIIGVFTYGLAKSEEALLEFTETAESVTERIVSPYDAELNLPDDFEYPVGDDSPGAVIFSHENHIYMQDETDCGICHSSAFSIIRDNTLNVESVIMDDMYEGQSCGKCHNGEDAFSAEDDCEACHME